MQPVFNVFQTDCQTQTQTQTAVECRMMASGSASIAKILDVSAKSEITGFERVGDELQFSGRCNFYALYLTDDGKVAAFDYGVQFSDVTPLADGERITDVFSDVEDVEVVSAQGSELICAAVLKVTRVSSCEEEVRYLAEADVSSMMVREAAFDVPKTIVSKVSEFALQEDVEIEGVVERILSASATLIVKECTCGLDCIVVEGELVTPIVFSSEDGTKISCVNVLTPFRQEIEAEGSQIQFSCLARGDVKSVRVNALVDESKGNSHLQIDYALRLVARAISVSNIVAIKDAFSVDKELETSQKSLSLQSLRGVLRSVEELSGITNLEDNQPKVEGILCAVGNRANIVKMACEEGFVTVEGIASSTVIYRAEEGLSSAQIELPFSAVLKNERIRKGDEARGNIAVLSVLPKSKLPDEIEVEMRLQLTVTCFGKEQMTCICDLIEGEEKKDVGSGISVYFPEAGEGLWEIAKRLNVLPEAILSENDVTFPLSGEEKIVVYRQCVVKA